MTLERARREAARWYARMHAPDCSARERAELEQWRQSAAAHAAAYAAVQDLAEGLTRLAATDDKLRALADEAYALGAADPRAEDAAGGGRLRRWTRHAALAAGLAAAFLIVASASHLFGPAAPEHTVYATLAAEQRELELADGTVIHLDVRSELHVLLTANERSVELVTGRAIFDVAHDPARPFSVLAGAGRITALGTRFQVQRTDHRFVVTLAEGSVAVSGETPGLPNDERLEPGEQLSYFSDSSRWVKDEVDARAATSWSYGRHVFRQLRLDEALNEVNRYSARKVRLGDPSLAELLVSGSFVVGDSERIASAFTAVLPIRMMENGREIVLFRRHEYEAD